MVGAVRHQFGFLAGQGRFVEHLALAAGDETRVAVHAGDETVTVSGHGETGERPEFGGRTAGWYLGGAFEADNS